MVYFVGWGHFKGQKSSLKQELCAFALTLTKHLDCMYICMCHQACVCVPCIYCIPTLSITISIKYLCKLWENIITLLYKLLQVKWPILQLPLFYIYSQTCFASCLMTSTCLELSIQVCGLNEHLNGTATRSADPPTQWEGTTLTEEEVSSNENFMKDLNLYLWEQAITF